MRDLPLNDPQWVHQNIYQFRDLSSKLNVGFKSNIQIIIPYSDVNINGTHNDLFPSQNVKGKQVIFRDRVTNEIFKYTFEDEYLYDFVIRILNLCLANNSGIVIKEKPQLIKFRVCELTDNIFKHATAKGEVVKVIIENSIKPYSIYDLPKSDQSILVDYCKGKIDVKPYYEDKCMIFLLESGDDPCFLRDIEAKISKDVFINSCSAKLRKSTLNSIKMKFLLLKTGNFTSVYKVNTYKYNDTLKDNVFDTVVITLNMTATDHDNHSEFIKKNRKKINTILTAILKLNSKTHKYVNYLELYDLTLTHDNILEAKFCFKKGLEELLNGEETQNDIQN